MANTHTYSRTGHAYNKSLCPVCGGLECLCRPRFFAGQLLTEEDLQALDHYIIEKNKLHNRYLHGTGVVCGLEVLCHECKGWVTIKQGYALDPCGNDIVVCEDYSFDLCAKIEQCCDRKRKDWECEPMASPPPDCKDVDQCWYVTLRYKESESRGITALKSPRAEPCCDTCGCGSNSPKGQCRCSCHTNGHTHESTKYSTSVRRPPLQCEPTRVCEGYVVEVSPAPPREREKSPLKMFDGTLLARLYECAKEVEDVKSTRPTDTDLQGKTPERIQQACCLYKKVVWDFLKRHDLTRCELLARVSEQQCSPDLAAAKATRDYLDVLLDQFLQDCACLALLPPCPPDPGDSRVILACVRVKRQGKDCHILDICHWHGRRFVWTWPNVFYWLPVGALFKQIFENACCNKAIPEPAPPRKPITVTIDPPHGSFDTNQTTGTPQGPPPPTELGFSFDKAVRAEDTAQKGIVVMVTPPGGTATSVPGNVKYEAATFKAVFTPTRAFGDGEYVVTVFGSGSNPIIDADGLAFDGNKDGTGGDDAVSKFNVFTHVPPIF